MDERPAINKPGLDEMDLPLDLRPGEAVLARLMEGRERQQGGDHAGAAKIYTNALEMARSRGDRSGAARALAQLAALEEANGNVAAARIHNEQTRGEWPEEIADVAEIVRTAAAVFPPLAVMATEADLSPEQRRSLAARATHQAWMVDAFTRRRWNLADLVDETLKARLDFHERLD